MQVFLADVLDEKSASVRLRLDTGLAESLRDPGNAAALRGVVDQKVSGLGARFRNRRVLLHLEPDERKDRVWSRCCEVRRNRFCVGCLPTSGCRAAWILLLTIDLGYDHEPCVAEEAAGIAEIHDVGATHLKGRHYLDRFRDETCAQAL